MAGTLFDIPGASTAKLEGTATAADVLSGKTFYKNDQRSKLTGTMPNNGAISKNFTPSAVAQSFNIPRGFTTGGTISISAIPDSEKICTALGARKYQRHNDSWTYTDDSIWDTGNNKQKALFLYIVNMGTFKIEGTNDLTNWTQICQISTNGSSDGAWGNPNMATASNLTYRYYRATYAGYNNGGDNFAFWGMATC